MFLADPPRTQYDLNFTLAGVPVRVHPLFWLVGLVFGYGGVPPDKPALLVAWLAVFFVSILVHEMGHALTMRYYGWNPSVTLYAMGGFARYDGGFTANFSSYQRKGNREFAQLIISAAGPAAGFLMAGLIVLVARLLGGNVQFDVGLRSLVTWQITQIDDNLRFLMDCFLLVNIYWGLLNLLPVYPLDGGQISRELFTRYSVGDGIQRSLWLSIATGAGLAAYGLYHGAFYMGLLFAYLAFSSYQLLQSYTGGGFGGFGGRNPW